VSEPANSHARRPRAIARSFCPCRAGGRGPLPLARTVWAPPSPPVCRAARRRRCRSCRGNARRSHRGRGMDARPCRLRRKTQPNGRMEDDCARGSAPRGGLVSRLSLGDRRLCGAPRRSLARPSRNPGSPSCAHARPVGNDPAEPRQPARIGRAQAPNGALSSAANGASTGRSRPQSQGGSQPPRHNAQALDVARKRVTAAGRASVVGAPSAGPSGEHPPAGGRALLGSAVRWYPSPTWGHGHGASGECSPHGGRAHDGASVASPMWEEQPSGAGRPRCRASDQAHRDWGRVDP
jgi:hypothetical protein